MIPLKWFEIEKINKYRMQLNKSYYIVFLFHYGLYCLKWDCESSSLFDWIHNLKITSNNHFIALQFKPDLTLQPLRFSIKYTCIYTVYT
jgi:hypothetical protein